ncbi:hypothetical protein [Cohaesibacter celericrescens]|uniref:Uncharacterized protein n=1 Tax=Cohaesibacter celericrescens TaxID=2067669 RepID=A0A2N5XT23_9HYPH|nr:hypothetical protein [Cohaesibacter celericrescens]PLW77654.1 hypothetical protein C0081_10175 [Cohaesibacter celericrescens]
MISIPMVWVSSALAGEVDVIDAQIKKETGGTYSISATLKHADEGWDHYADAWDVLAPNGSILTTRVLAHPHVNEQPFTRSKGGIEIPHDISEVTIRGKDTVHGYGGKTFKLTISR